MRSSTAEAWVKSFALMLWLNSVFLLFMIPFTLILLRGYFDGQYLLVIVSAIFFAFALFFAWLGFDLWRFKEWSRYAVLVLGWLGIITAIIVGMWHWLFAIISALFLLVPSIFQLWLFHHPSIKRIFTGHARARVKKRDD